MMPFEPPLPPGFRETGTVVEGKRVVGTLFEGPARKVGPDAFMGLVRVVLGTPGPDADHDCDALGCGSLGEHVLSREELPSPWITPHTAEDYAAGRYRGVPRPPVSERAQHRANLMHHANPERPRLVWESARGPVLVEEMDVEWLERAIPVAERIGSPALDAMRARLDQLRRPR